jgi:hypothetical protein
VYGQSSVLVFALGLSAMFSILYISSMFSEPGHAHFDNTPTEPQISQLEAIKVVEQDSKSKRPNSQEAKLMFQLYNFSTQHSQPDLTYQDYFRSIG